LGLVSAVLAALMRNTKKYFEDSTFMSLAGDRGSAGSRIGREAHEQKAHSTLRPFCFLEQVKKSAIQRVAVGFHCFPLLLIHPNNVHHRLQRDNRRYWKYPACRASYAVSGVRKSNSGQSRTFKSRRFCERSSSQVHFARSDLARRIEARDDDI
jgi:hypothetical protein